MHGTVDQGLLTSAPPSGVGFKHADRGDDAELRRLLRQAPLLGSIQVALECEPSYMDARAILGDRHTTVVSRTVETGRIVGLGSRSVRSAYLNGRVVRLGYLTHLRVDRACDRRLAVLRGGYALIGMDRLEEEAPVDLTSMIAHNGRARRLLEGGLPGLPVYTEYDRFFTLAIPTGGSTRHERRAHDVDIEPGSRRRLPQIVECLQRNLCRYQFAPHWTKADLLSSDRCRDLRLSSFRLALRGDRIVGCAAVWDQRAFKQAVIRGYSPGLKRWRPAVNLGAMLLGRPLLPRIGEPVPGAFLSHLAADADLEMDAIIALIESARRCANERSIPLLLAGFGSRHPALPAVRRSFRHHLSETVLYSVSWPGADDPLFELDGRPAQPEVAAL